MGYIPGGGGEGSSSWAISDSDAAKMVWNAAYLGEGAYPGGGGAGKEAEGRLESGVPPMIRVALEVEHLRAARPAQLQEHICLAGASAAAQHHQPPFQPLERLLARPVPEGLVAGVEHPHPHGRLREQPGSAGRAHAAALAVDEDFVPVGHRRRDRVEHALPRRVEHRAPALHG
eukprot:scaffold21778_cov131-Isochrysis_galbana.AAC.12